MNEKIKDYMREDLPGVGLGTKLEKVREIMTQENVELVLVKDAGELIGVISITDVLAYLAKGQGSQELTADSFMTSCKLSGVNPCLRVFEDSPIEDACAIMGSTGENYLLVFGKDNLPTGVVAAKDLLKCME